MQEIPVTPVTSSRELSACVRTNPPKQLNVNEAAAYIGVSPRTLRTWISERKISVARLGGRVVLRLVDVDRFIESRVQGGSL